MLDIVAMKIRLALTAALLCCVSSVRGDEQLFGFVRGAETLPAQRFELYQFITLRQGKDQGTYYGFDSETEFEYGVLDQLQMSASLVQHYFYNQDVPELPIRNNYRFGGVEDSAKYRILSPFKDR